MSNFIPPKEQNIADVQKTIRSIFDKEKATKFNNPLDHVPNPYLNITDKLGIPPVSRLTLNNLIIKNKVDQRSKIFQNIYKKKAIKA